MGLYTEIHRPQFHFTPRENWLNDPNGLVHDRGTWHLFFQHNIEAPTWGKMWWGHAYSKDLLHWKQSENALEPDEMGSIFSGSAVVDHTDSAGFGAGAILLFYTAAGMHAEPPRKFTQCLAYSQDGGKSWKKHDQNPIIEWMEAENRDPRVIWHEARACWIMALYLNDEKFCLLSSSDAKTWTHLQDVILEGDNECPDFFPMTDDAGKERWIFSGASGIYLVGTFDGFNFSVETEPRNFEHGRNGYASQTWTNAPDGRRVQISWMAGGRYPEMSFNQQMSIPVDLSLEGSGKDVTIKRWPIKELDSLRVRTITLEECLISPKNAFTADTQAKLLDVSFTVNKQLASTFDVVVRGHHLGFLWHKNQLLVGQSFSHKMDVGFPFIELPDKPTISIRLIVDKTSIEIFLDDGRISASFCFLPDGYIHPLVLHSFGGNQVIKNFQLHELSSIWKKDD